MGNASPSGAGCRLALPWCSGGVPGLSGCAAQIAAVLRGEFSHAHPPPLPTCPVWRPRGLALSVAKIGGTCHLSPLCPCVPRAGTTVWAIGRHQSDPMAARLSNERSRSGRRRPNWRVTQWLMMFLLSKFEPLISCWMRLGVAHASLQHKYPLCAMGLYSLNLFSQ